MTIGLMLSADTAPRRSVRPERREAIGVAALLPLPGSFDDPHERLRLGPPSHP